GLLARVTGIRRDASRDMGFVIPGVRIRDDMKLPTNAYSIRIRQASVAEDIVYPDRRLALPGAMTRTKPRGIEVKDPSFGLDAVWVQPHQMAEVEADDHVVVEPDSVIATHLSQVLYRHAADLLGADDVQDLLDNLEASAPTLVASVVPNLVPLHVLTAVLRTLLKERMPVADLPRILEELSAIAGRITDPTDMAEHVRPALSAQLLEQISPVTQSLPVITLSAELEELLTRSQHERAGLVIDPGLANRIMSEINVAQEALAGAGKRGVVVVSAGLRRSFATFVRGHGSDAIVLAVTEIPDHRRLEIVASVAAKTALTQEETP
ncbi:MAG: FHIPEP family type III secretion protein, partial [Pseudomonadota bacterium]